MVEVLDHFQDERGQYLVMELVEGTDLGVLLQARAAIPACRSSDAIEYARQACEALQYVHEQQIVHRDVKPQNLILGERRRRARRLRHRARSSDEEEDAGTVGIGTPRFMAPEVFAGGTVSPRSDVFGLAATLWTLITGKPPVYGDPTELARARARRHARARGDVAAGLEMIPERRVASVAAFADGARRAARSATAGDSLAMSRRRPAPRRAT